MHNVTMVLGAEVFDGRWLGHDECTYIKEALETFLLPSTK